MLIKTNYFLIFLLNFLYVFRSIAVVLGIEKIIYLISALLILVNYLYIFFYLKKYYVDIVSVFIFVGCIILLYSMLLNPPIVGIVGFTVIFLNLLLWHSLIRVFHKERFSDFFVKFVNINIYFACITSILGIYQYFFDPSIMGLALHDIYGNSDLMASGRFVRRVTALLGSPQNYALYLAIATSLVSYVSVSKKKRILIYLILLSGGLVSGSRAYSLFLVMIVLFTTILNLFLTPQTMNRLIKKVTLFGVGFITICFIFSINFSNNTVNRMVNLINDWPALEIYKYHLRSLDSVSIWLGNGLGVNERIVVQLLGATYSEVVGIYVYSYESYLLSVLMQMGLVGIIIFLSIYIKALLGAYKSKNALYISVLVAIVVNIMVTPSFNGFAMSFIVWPILLYPIYAKSCSKEKLVSKN